MLTGNDEAADKVEAFASGVDDYIVKPFSSRDLTSRVNAAMGQRRGAPRASPSNTGGGVRGTSVGNGAR